MTDLDQGSDRSAIVVWLSSSRVRHDEHVNGQSNRWDPQRLIHRQIYIDLIRAYLLDYGTQRDLARALGMSEAYASYLLAPVRSATARGGHWSVVLRAAGHDIAEAFRFLKTPSQIRAQQIAGQLCNDAERRDVLLHHIDLARRGGGPAAGAALFIPADEADAAIKEVDELHQLALHATNALVTAESYAQVWDKARMLPAVIDPQQNPAAHAQALMFLHDTAQVLGRPDLALGFSRNAIAVISAADAGDGEDDELIRLRINAMLAEVVTLNTLGLRADAARTIAFSESLAGYHREPEIWLRSFLEQKLIAMTGSARASVYDAEAIADSALNLAGSDAIIQAGIKRRLMDLYLARPTGRSQRKASQLEGDLRDAIDAGSQISPLRRAQILRTLIRYARSICDSTTARTMVIECLRLTEHAQLVHQRRALIRDLAAIHPPVAD